MFKLWAKTMTHPRPAYTPRAEYQCEGSTTHYQGCKCHEARRDAELAAVTKERQGLESRYEFALDQVHEQLEASRAECAVLRSTLEDFSMGVIPSDEYVEHHAKKALTTSSGESLAAVRGAMRTLADADGALSNNNAMDFEDIPRALAELKRVFGDAR